MSDSPMVKLTDLAPVVDLVELDKELHEAIKFIVMTSVNMDSQSHSDAAQCIITASGILAKVQDTIVELARSKEQS